MVCCRNRKIVNCVSCKIQNKNGRGCKQTCSYVLKACIPCPHGDFDVDGDTLGERYISSPSSFCFDRYTL